MVTPSTNNTSGQYTITLYYTEAEIAGWETGSGDVRANLNILKSAGGISASDEYNSQGEDSPTYASFGSDHTYSATFSTGFSGFGVSNAPSSALPITLLDFTGTKVNTTAMLNWSTEQEINNDYFTLERSTDGQTFEVLSEISGAGTTNEIQRYQYLDKHPKVGANYYRLKQTDFDGRFKYVGDIVVLDFDEKGDMSIYPNPVLTGQLRLSYTAIEDNKELELFIYSLDGKQVQKAIFNVEEGPNTIYLDVHRLGGGVYILKTLQGEIMKNSQFVISKNH